MTGIHGVEEMGAMKTGCVHREICLKREKLQETGRDWTGSNNFTLTAKQNTGFVCEYIHISKRS